MIGMIAKVVISTGVGVASQIVAKSAMINLVELPSKIALRAVYAVGIGGIGLVVANTVGDTVVKTYDAVAELGHIIKEKVSKKKETE